MGISVGTFSPVRPGLTGEKVFPTVSLGYFFTTLAHIKGKIAEKLIYRHKPDLIIFLSH